MSPLLRTLAFALALQAGFVMTGPARAQTAQDCLADLEAFDAWLASWPASGQDGSFLKDYLAAGAIPTIEGDRCAVEILSSQISPNRMIRQEFVLSRVSWRAEWADETRPMPPARLSLDVGRIRHLLSVEPTIQSDAEARAQDFGKINAYQMELLSDLMPVSLQLDFAYDHDSRQLDLTRLAMQRGTTDSFSLSASLSGIDLRALPAGTGKAAGIIGFLVPAAIHSADLSLTNGGMFESVSAVWIMPIYPKYGETPAAAVENVKLLASVAIRNLPDFLLDDRSRNAFGEMVDSLPHPLGTLHLTLDSPDGLRPGSLIMRAALLEKPDLSHFEDAFAGTEITARWTPLPQAATISP